MVVDWCLNVVSYFSVLWPPSSSACSSTGCLLLRSCLGHDRSRREKERDSKERETKKREFEGNDREEGSSVTMIAVNRMAAGRVRVKGKRKRERERYLATWQAPTRLFKYLSKILNLL